MHETGLKATDVVYGFISSFWTPGRLLRVYFVLRHCAKGTCVLTTELFRLPQQLSEAWSPAGRTDVAAKRRQRK